MTPDTETFVAWVFARPLGAEFETTGIGTSMFPLLQAGDVLRVRRCEEGDIRRGDLVFLVREDDAFVVHLAERVRPLVTASFLGREDLANARVAGKVIQVRRGHLDVPWPGWLSPMTFVASRVLRRARDVRARLRGRS